VGAIRAARHVEGDPRVLNRVGGADVDPELVALGSAIGAGVSLMLSTALRAELCDRLELSSSTLQRRVRDYSRRMR